MRIVIIGGGLSSALLTINLLRQKQAAFIDIIVIERNPPEMLGQAYSTDRDFHLLNVPAQKMSAFSDQSEDFTDWLAEAGYNFGSRSYVPRRIYRLYIKDTLKKELNKKGPSAKYTVMQDCAVDIVPSGRSAAAPGGAFFLVLASGRKIQFDRAILALGNFQPASLNLEDSRYLQHPSYFASAGDYQQFQNRAPIGDVVIIGTGLTMVDTVLCLQQQQYRGQITALSSHGLIPAAHQGSPPYEISDLDCRTVSTALDILRIVNRHLKEARRQGIGWQAVVDAVRPFTQELWLHLPASEKKKFMQHLRPIWNIARHRMPAECAGIIHNLLSEKRLSIVAGRVRSIRVEAAGKFCMEYKDRMTEKSQCLTSTLIINCMGPESNYGKLKDLLIKNLLAKGLIRTDNMQLGIDCTPEGALIEKNGRQSSFLYTIGPPAKGVLWESTSVPEIRMAALHLATLLAEKARKVETPIGKLA